MFSGSYEMKRKGWGTRWEWERSKEVVAKGLLAEDPVRQAYDPFIDELRNRDL